MRATYVGLLVCLAGLSGLPLRGVAQSDGHPLVMASASVPPGKRMPQRDRPNGLPPVRVDYRPATNRLTQRAQRWLRHERSLERLVADLHQGLSVVPAKAIVVQECQQPEVAYQAQSQTVRLCYELLIYLEGSFADLSASRRERSLGVLDATYFLVLRELSRGLLHQGLGQPLPPQTELEQVLDELAIVLPALTSANSAAVSLSGVQWLFNQGRLSPMVQSLPYWQRAKLGLDRYEALICLAYGSAPQRFPYLAAEVAADFPRVKSQLSSCEQRAEMARRRWQRRLG